MELAEVMELARAGWAARPGPEPCAGSGVGRVQRRRERLG